MHPLYHYEFLIVLSLGAVRRLGTFTTYYSCQAPTDLQAFTNLCQNADYQDLAMEEVKRVEMIRSPV